MIIEATFTSDINQSTYAPLQNPFPFLNNVEEETYNIEENKTIPPEVICIKNLCPTQHPSIHPVPEKITQARNIQMFFQLEIFLALLIFLIGLFIICKKAGKSIAYKQQRCDEL